MAVSVVSVNDFRLRPLSAGLAMALAAGSLAPALANSSTVAARPMLAAFSAHAAAGDPFGLHARFAAARAAVRPAPANYVGVRSVVGDCGDGAGPTTLRNLIAAATSGDTIDLSTSGCSTITLTQGQIAIPLASLTIIGPTAKTTIDANHLGRALYHSGTGGTLTLQNMVVTNGSGGYESTNNAPSTVGLGGAILSLGNVTLSNSAVTNSTVTGQGAIGGGIAATGVLTLNNSVISGNTASARVPAPPPPPGQAVQPAAIDGSTIEVIAVGGGFFSGPVVMTNSTVTGNAAVADPRVSGSPNVGAVALAGAGIAGKYSTPTDGTQSPAGTVPLSTITGSTIDSNSAHSLVPILPLPTTGTTTSAGLVGGVFAANLTLVDSTISDNSAEYIGAEASKYQLTAYNSTITANTAYGLGGVYIGGNATLDLHSTIIAGNSAENTTLFAVDLSGPVAQPAGALLKTFTGQQLAAPITPSAITLDVTHSLIGGHDASIVLPPGTLTGNPQLGPLQFNGGPTRTHAPNSGSPVIDAGDNLLNLPNDQRGAGFPRVLGAAPDIGAVEVLGGPARIIPTLSGWMLGLFASVLALAGWRAQHRRSAINR